MHFNTEFIHHYFLASWIWINSTVIACTCMYFSLYPLLNRLVSGSALINRSKEKVYNIIYALQTWYYWEHDLHVPLSLLGHDSKQAVKLQVNWVLTWSNNHEWLVSFPGAICSINDALSLLPSSCLQLQPNYHISPLLYKVFVWYTVHVS